jgi:hypothetical protein
MASINSGLRALTLIRLFEGMPLSVDSGHRHLDVTKEMLEGSLTLRLLYISVGTMSRNAVRSRRIELNK